MIFHSKKEALNLIADALTAFKAVHLGLVSHNGKPVFPNLRIWGMETEGCCEVCLAGAYHLAKTGEIKRAMGLRPQVEVFLDSLRAQRPAALRDLRRAGVEVPVSSPLYSCNNPDDVIEWLEELLRVNSQPAPAPTKQKQPVSVSA